MNIDFAAVLVVLTGLTGGIWLLDALVWAPRRARVPVAEETGTARPVHIGKTTQVWQIDMVNDAGELTCVSRITMAILPPRS